jgi:hypothetical protein
MVKLEVSFDGGDNWSIIPIKNVIQLSTISEHVSYIEGSRTYDNLRYGSRVSKHMPHTFEFTDATNSKFRVTIERESDVLNMVVPCGTEMYWFGADSSPTRTGSDAQTSWAHFQFSYIPSDWINYGGVRIQFEAYRDKNKSEWSVDTQRWKTVLEMTKQGLEITGEVINQSGKVAVMIA